MKASLSRLIGGDVSELELNRPGFSRHFWAVRNIAFHSLLAAPHQHNDGIPPAEAEKRLNYVSGFSWPLHTLLL